MSSDPPAAPAARDTLLAEADRRHRAGDWAAALALYCQAVARDPGAALAAAAPIGIGHCRIELAAAAELSAVAPDGAPCPDSATRSELVTRVRHRALALCAAGDVLRASCLLRFLASYDGVISTAYAHQIFAARTADAAPVDDDGESPFLAATGLTDDRVAAARERHRGRRVLLAVPRYLERRYETVDNLMRAAADFGLAVREFNTHPKANQPERFASTLLAAILEFKPDVIYYADLFETDLASRDAALAQQVAEVLAMARTTLGARVVRYLTDAWHTTARVGGDLRAGLRYCVDLVLHHYPGLLQIEASPAAAAVFCYPTPIHLPASTVAQGTIPRACFAGRIHEWAYGRAVWWAEILRAGLPVDFAVQLPWDTGSLAEPPLSDRDYADGFRAHAVSLSFTSRLTGRRSLTGRPFEILLCGGVPLEEDTAETAYFLKPGRHYRSFETLADLRELLPALIADRSGRLALADAGRRWVEKYFTGDYFWAGLLDKLAALG